MSHQMGWPKHLSVDKRIILLLSASTYESFPRALRELVSNAYDADATKVDISLSEREHTLRVTDNGCGMTPDEFDFYLRIAGRQRSRIQTTVLNRKRIGQFGIGFLAMFPFCERVEIQSTVERSPVVFKARIPAAKFLADRAKVEDLTGVDVVGHEYRDENTNNEHFTRLTLINTNDLLRRYLAQRHDQRKSRNSIRSYPGMSRFRWELQDILPIQFPNGSLIAPYVNPDPTGFDVNLNDRKLVRNDYVKEVLAHSEDIERVGDIAFRYAIGTPWKAVKPDEARGMRVRLNQVGVGPRQYFDLGIAGRTFSRLHWLTGEINIVSGLDETITLDRESFTASQDYEDFREFFRSKLRELAFYLEDVDEAKRKIIAQTTQSPRAETAPSEQVIKTQLDRLKRRGFEVREEFAQGLSAQKPSINIDTRRKVVKVISRKEPLADTITIARRTWRVKFSRWNFHESPHNACRITGKSSIELNQNYPLFHGVNKDTFRRLQVVLALAEQESKTKGELFDNIQRLLLLEFERR